MSIEEWWPKLRPTSKSWLIEHNGEPVPPHLVDEIAEAGGQVSPDPDADSDGDETDFLLTDEQIDWVEELANDDGLG